MQENFATNGFLDQMTNKSFGTYVILGATGSGRSTLLLKYLKKVPEAVKPIFQFQPGEHSQAALRTINPSIIVPMNTDIVKIAQIRRASVIVSDQAHSTKNFQDLLMLSVMANTALTLHANSIPDFLLRTIQDPDYRLGERSLLERIKGLTLARSVHLSNGQRVNLQESLSLNSENVENFVKAAPLDIPKLVQREIVRQGMATIEQQIANLEAVI